ncbi:Replication protein A DNA-binding subunit C [Glycine soja]
MNYVENTEIPMVESLTTVQNFGFLVKIPIAESLTPVQVFCFLVIYALQGWVGFLPPCCHVLFYGSMIMDFGVRLWFPVRDFRSFVVEGLCNFMARIHDKIWSIDGSKETLKLVVRITDLWFVGTPNKSEQAEMVFVDYEGDQIHAICKSDHLKSWKADLKENCTYVMHNFKVVKNDGQFRVCEHEYKLFFIGVTVVREADLHELPFKEFRFVEFANVVAGNFVSGLLVDIIGVVDQVVFRHVSSKNTRVVFRMKDLSGEILSCTLWENYCTQFLSYLNEPGDDGSMVIILTHARIKDAQGSYPASVSNSFKASKLLINDPILEIQEFKERLLDLGVEVSRVLLPGDQASSQVSGGITVGTISKIVMDNHSWCYPVCAQCHRKTDIQTGPFTCGCGKDNDQPVLRVEVMVTQNNESSKFLLWDRECTKLIGETADDVNRVKIEACSKIDPSNVDCNDATHAEFDHDPVAGLPLTPKKRMSSDEADEELGSSQISPAQLSRSKLRFVHINYQHAKRSDSAKAKINRKRIMQQKRHGHAQSSSQPTLNCTSEYNKLSTCKEMRFCKSKDQQKMCYVAEATWSCSVIFTTNMIVSDSSESENSESTQGSGSNFMNPFEDCQSPTNQPVINTKGYSDLGDQLIQYRYCNAQIQYSRIQNHIVSALSHMFDQHNSHAKSFRMPRDRLATDQANNIKLQLIAARGKDGRVYNMPNVPEIAALIVGDFHPGSKRDIIVETQNVELQRIHELHPSYLPLQYPLLFPYGEDGYRADILHRFTSSSKKRKRNRLTMREWFAYRLQSRSNEAQTLLHSRKLFQQFIVDGYTMVESERLSYIRNNQKKLRVDKYSSLQTSLDTGTAKGLTKGKRVILPSMFVGSPRYMDQLYFDGMAICSHVGFPNLFITLTCNPNWPEIRRLLSPLNLKLIDRLDIVSRIFRLKYEHMLSDLTKGQLLGKVVAYMHTIEFQKRGLPHINDDTLRNLTLIEIEQLLHINQRSLKDYPTMPYPQDINLTSYLQNNLPLYYYQDAELHIPDLKFLYQFLKTQHGQSLSMVGLYLPKPVFTHGQLYVALSRVNSAKGLKILIHDDEYPIVRPPAIMQFRVAFHNDQTFIEIPLFYHEQWAPNYPHEVRFKCNGATYPIRIQQHRGRYFFADGLSNVRADLKIYEYIIINFFACDDNTIFDLHFTPPLNQQTCGRPILHSRVHAWRTEITQCILGAPQPLEIPSHARKYLKQCENHLTILRKNAPPLQWDVVTLDRGIKDKSIVRPWYKFLRENNFHHGDEVSFYYRPHERIWEIVIRRERKWL